MYQQRPQGMQPQRPGQIPSQMQQQQQQMQQQRMGRPGMPQGNYPNQTQMGMHHGGQPPHQQQQPQQSRGQPPQPQQQQQQQQQAPPQISPQIPKEKKSRACATNDKIEKSRFATKESEYDTKFSNRYKDASFQSKEKMPEPFIWVNMPSQNLKNDRNRPRDNKKKGKNNDDYYRDRESRGRY